jgi:class 3 adenylate cyclase
MLLEGLTVLRASQLETSPSMLCVIDAAADGKLGGTHASFGRWQLRIGAPQTIALRKLRERSAAKGPAPMRTVPSRSLEATTSAIPAPTVRPQRTLKTMLFADFAGFSRLHEAAVPLFQSSFWKIAADQIEASPVKPLLASTWGDALYVVFDAPQDGAAFALGFLERMRAVDWSAAGLPESSQMRVALHAGPVFRGFDPIMNRDSYFGSSVTRAARIEPVTPPGMVYASEAFAATLAATALGELSLEYVGRLPLAKGYGESRIYRLERG